MVLKQRAIVAGVQAYRYSSPNVPLPAIQRFARRIAERFQPQKIVLFGSYAYGTPHSESDVDLLVVMPAHNEISKSVRISLAFEPPFALDLIVRTPQHLERGLREGDWFLREVMEKGKVLYEAPHSGVGAKSRGRYRHGKAAGGAGTLHTQPVAARLTSAPPADKCIPRYGLPSACGQRYVAALALPRSS